MQFLFMRVDVLPVFRAGQQQQWSAQLGKARATRMGNVLHVGREG